MVPLWVQCTQTMFTARSASLTKASSRCFRLRFEATVPLFYVVTCNVDDTLCCSPRAFPRRSWSYNVREQALTQYASIIIVVGCCSQKEKELLSLAVHPSSLQWALMSTGGDRLRAVSGACLSMIKRNTSERCKSEPQHRKSVFMKKSSTFCKLEENPEEVFERSFVIFFSCSFSRRRAPRRTPLSFSSTHQRFVSECSVY